MLSVFYLVYAWVVRGKNRQRIPGTHVQNLASRTETRQIVSSTPNEKKNFAPAMRVKVHGSRPDPNQCVRPGFSHVNHLAFCKNCSYEERCSEKYDNFAKIRYIHPSDTFTRYLVLLIIKHKRIDSGDSI